MRFSKVGIIGTLMAAMLAMLVVLPILASNGTKFDTSGDDKLTLSVYAYTEDLTTTTEIDDATVSADAEDTRLGNTLFASNDTTAFNQVLVQIIDPTPTVSSITVDVEADKDFHVASVEKVFTPMMIFTAAAMAFAHGSNDVANGVGPLAAVYALVRSGGEVTQKSGRNR